MGECIDYGMTCLQTDFTRLLLEHYNIKDLEGKFLKDKRGGALNIHSWDFEYKGKVSAKQKELLNLLFKQRRRHFWAKEIGIRMDGWNAIDNKADSTFFNDENLQLMLDDLVCKTILFLNILRKRYTIQKTAIFIQKEFQTKHYLKGITS